MPFHMSSFPQNGHHAFTIMQSKLFEIQVRELVDAMHEKQVPKDCYVIREGESSSAFFTVYIRTRTLIRNLKYCYFNQNFVILSPPLDQLAIKLLHKLRKKKKICGFGSDERPFLRGRG